MSGMRGARPLSRAGGVPIAASVKMGPQAEPSATIEREEDVTVSSLLQRIRAVNDTANECVELLKAFNQKVTELISSSAKQQILKLGEGVIEPRIKEQYRFVGRLQHQVAHPEQNMASLARISERIAAVEERVDGTKFQKLQSDVQKIKDMLLKIVKIKKSEK